MPSLQWRLYSSLQFIFSSINFLLKKRKTTGHHLTLTKQIFIVCRIILANFKLILLQLEFTIHHRRYNNFSHSSRCCATSLANYAAMRGIKKKEKYFGFVSFPRTFNLLPQKVTASQHVYRFILHLLSETCKMRASFCSQRAVNVVTFVLESYPRDIYQLILHSVCKPVTLNMYFIN